MSACPIRLAPFFKQFSNAAVHIGPIRAATYSTPSTGNGSADISRLIVQFAQMQKRLDVFRIYLNCPTGVCESLVSASETLLNSTQVQTKVSVVGMVGQGGADDIAKHAEEFVVDGAGRQGQECVQKVRIALDLTGELPNVRFGLGLRSGLGKTN